MLIVFFIITDNVTYNVIEERCPALTHSVLSNPPGRGRRRTRTTWAGPSPGSGRSWRTTSSSAPSTSPWSSPPRPARPQRRRRQAPSRMKWKIFYFWLIFPVQPLAGVSAAGGWPAALPLSLQQIPGGQRPGGAALPGPARSDLRPGHLQSDQRVREAGEPWPWPSAWVVAPGHKSIITKTLRH